MKQKTNRFVAAMVTLSVTVFGILVGLTLWELETCRNSYLEWEQAEQQEIADEVAEEIKEFCETEKDTYRSSSQMESGLLSEVLTPLSSGSRQFYIIFKEDRLLFYQNEDLTEHRKEYKASDLWLEFSKNGGTDLNVLESRINLSQSGTISFVPSGNQDEYVAYLSVVTVEDTRYTVIYAEDSKWLLKQAGIQKFVILLLVEVMLCGMILVAGACISAVLYRNKVMEIQEKDWEIDRKNNLIVHLNRKLYPEDESDDWYGVCRDDRTGVYNEDFAQNLLANIDARNLTNVHLALLSACITKKDKNFGWRSITEEIGKHLDKSQTLLMIDPRRVAAISLKQSREEFEAQMQAILSEVEEEFSRIGLKMRMKICSKENTNESIVYLLQETIKEKNDEESHGTEKK
jgi:hypothetical protein